MASSTSPEEFRQLERDLMEKTLDKAANDPDWRQKLLEDPEQAQTEAGFPETERIREMSEKMTVVPETEVQAHDQLWEICYVYTALFEWVLFDT